MIGGLSEKMALKELQKDIHARLGNSIVSQMLSSEAVTELG
jgi:hypothetical protein